MNVTCRVHFDAAHRLMGYPGLCASIHGHRYVVDIEAGSAVDKHRLNALGIVIDFGMLKSVCGGWLDENWDHALILNLKDIVAIEAAKSVAAFDSRQRTFFVDEGNPTAEVMARFLLRKFRELMLPHSVRIIRVRVYETPDTWADAEVDVGQDL